MSYVLVIEHHDGRESVYGPFDDQAAAWAFAVSLPDDDDVSGHAHEVIELREPIYPPSKD